MTLEIVPSFTAPQGRWVRTWKAGDDTTPDIWQATKTFASGVKVAEIEVSNASIVPHQVLGRPVCEADVVVKPPSGHILVEDCPRPWPRIWFPMHAAFRRYAFYPRNRPDLRLEAESLAEGVPSSDFATNVAHFGPLKMALPKLNAHQRISAQARVAFRLATLRSLLVGGNTGPVEDSQDGLLIAPIEGWRPWGIVERFAQGGSGILFWTGWEQTASLAAYLWLVAACNHERRWHAYHRQTGEVISADDYGAPGPQYQEGTGDPNNGWLPEFVSVAASPCPLPLPYDEAHLVRGMRHLVALSDVVDSPMVYRALKGQAAQARLNFSEIGPTPTQWTVSLAQWLAAAKLSPHQGRFGQDNGRRMGWRAFLIAQSIKKGCTENVPWAQAFLELVTTAAMPTGVFSRSHDQPGSIWYDPQNDTAQSFEVPILWGGATACARVTGSPAPKEMQTAARALYEGAPQWPYYGTNVGPPHFAFVARRDGAPYPRITGGKQISPPGDATHVHTGTAIAASESDREHFLEVSAKTGSVFGDWHQKLAWLETQDNLLDEYAGLYAQMQIEDEKELN